MHGLGPRWIQQMCWMSCLYILCVDLYTKPLPNKTVFYPLGADIVPLKMYALDSQLLVITTIIFFSFLKAFPITRQTSLSPSPYLGLQTKGLSAVYCGPVRLKLRKAFLLLWVSLSFMHCPVCLPCCAKGSPWMSCVGSTGVLAINS